MPPCNQRCSSDTGPPWACAPLPAAVPTALKSSALAGSNVRSRHSGMTMPHAELPFALHVLGVAHPAASRSLAPLLRRVCGVGGVGSAGVRHALGRRRWQARAQVSPSASGKTRAFPGLPPNVAHTRCDGLLTSAVGSVTIILALCRSARQTRWRWRATEGGNDGVFAQDSRARGCHGCVWRARPVARGMGMTMVSPKPLDEGGRGCRPWCSLGGRSSAR